MFPAWSRLSIADTASLEILSAWIRFLWTKVTNHDGMFTSEKKVIGSYCAFLFPIIRIAQPSRLKGSTYRCPLKCPMRFSTS